MVQLNMNSKPFISVLNNSVPDDVINKIFTDGIIPEKYKGNIYAYIYNALFYVFLCDKSYFIQANTINQLNIIFGTC